MLALLASSASAAYKMHLYEDLACTDAPWEISFEGSTCTGDDPFLWTDGDGESLPRPGYYFKNGFRSFQYYPTTTTMNVYSTTDCTGVNYGNTLYDAATSCKADNTQCCQLVNDVEGDFLISYKIEEVVASPPPATASPGRTVVLALAVVLGRAHVCLAQAHTTERPRESLAEAIVQRKLVRVAHAVPT